MMESQILQRMSGFLPALTGVFTAGAALLVLELLIDADWINAYLVPPPSGDPVTVQLDYFREFPRPLVASDEAGFLQYHPRAVLWGALQVAYLYLHEVEMSAGIATIYSDLTAGAAARDHGARVGATQQPRVR